MARTQGCVGAAVFEARCFLLLFSAGDRVSFEGCGQALLSSRGFRLVVVRGGGGGHLVLRLVVSLFPVPPRHTRLAVGPCCRSLVTKQSGHSLFSDGARGSVLVEPEHETQEAVKTHHRRPEIYIQLMMLKTATVYLEEVSLVGMTLMSPSVAVATVGK